jgi:hypothetical protein
MLVTFCKSTGDGGRLLRTRPSSTKTRSLWCSVATIADLRWVRSGYVPPAGRSYDHVDGTIIPMGLDRRRSWCRGASRCFWELTRAVLQTSCDLLHLTEYLKGTFRFPYPPLVQSRTYRGGSAIRRVAWKSYENSTLFSVFLLTRNFISGPDA